MNQFDKSNWPGPSDFRTPFAFFAPWRWWFLDREAAKDAKRRVGQRASLSAACQPISGHPEPFALQALLR
jgi:hypothetical protein